MNILKRSYIGVFVGIILVIPILFVMSNCNRSSSPLVKTDQYVPNILTPQNIFQISHIKGMELKNPRLKHGKYFKKAFL